jgi:hypothetical protein
LQVGNLGTSILGLEAANVITINQTAAGYNWDANASRPAADRVDLLTVLEHELGHVIGLADNVQAGDVMDTTIGLGVRRAPASEDVAAVVPVLSPALIGPVKNATVDAALASLHGAANDISDQPDPTENGGLTAESIGRFARLAVHPKGQGRATPSSASYPHGGLSSRFAFNIRQSDQLSPTDLKKSIKGHGK